MSEKPYTLADLQAAREEERERCAEAVFAIAADYDRPSDGVYNYNLALRDSIHAIRALGDAKEGKS